MKCGGAFTVRARPVCFGTQLITILARLLPLFWVLVDMTYCGNVGDFERKHLTFRTRLKRLARKTICYSKSLDMHKIMVSLLINHLEFGVNHFGV